MRLNFMSGVLAFALTAGLTLGTGAAHRQGDAGGALFTDAFETDAKPWVAFGPHGKVATTDEAAHVKTGKGALEFDFNVGDKSGEKPSDPNQLPLDVLLRPTPDGQLAKMQAVTFWARSDFASPYAVTLSEKGGGRYVSMIWLPKDTWRRVTLLPSDFWLSDDKNDPKDPDGKLDLDQVENVGVVSLWSFLALGAGDTPEGVELLAPKLGPHKFWLDDFSALPTAPAQEAPMPALPEKANGVWIDTMQRDIPFWMPLGNAELSIDPNAPFKGHALRADYVQGASKYIALIHDMRRANLAHKDRITFQVASAKSLKLAVALEEKSGARYIVILDVPGDSEPTRKSVSFSDFMIAEDSPKDPDGQLDLDQIKTISFVDITSAFGIDKQKNTLWIGPISAVAMNL